MGYIHMIWCDSDSVRKINLYYMNIFHFLFGFYIHVSRMSHHRYGVCDHILVYGKKIMQFVVVDERKYIFIYMLPYLK